MSSSGRSSLLREHYTHTSFSSSLLEEIYRSFDDEKDNSHNRKYHDGYRMQKSVSTNTSNSTTTYLDRDNRVILNRWIVDDKINRRRPIHYSSSISSSDSSTSFTGGFSSSDTESLYGLKKPTLKPVRTVTTPSETRRKSYFSDEFPKNNKKKLGGNNLQKRALKLYGDLKKVKHPISPGGKLASFLNSIFNNGGGSKKPKNGCDLERESVERERGTTATTSRSCLSKTPSSAGRFERRSVRFVDEQVRGHVTRSRAGSRADVAMRDSSLVNDEEFKVQIREKQRRVEMAKELLKNYHKNKELIKVNIVSDNIGRKILKNKVNNNIRKFEDEDEDEDEDDDASCCSSDLFELDHLLDIDRYQKELPVYETTHVDTNRAIANGYIF